MSGPYTVVKPQTPKQQEVRYSSVGETTGIYVYVDGKQEFFAKESTLLNKIVSELEAKICKGTHEGEEKNELICKVRNKAYEDAIDTVMGY